MLKNRGPNGVWPGSSESESGSSEEEEIDGSEQVEIRNKRKAAGPTPPTNVRKRTRGSLDQILLDFLLESLIACFKFVPGPGPYKFPIKFLIEYCNFVPGPHCYRFLN